MNKRKANKSPIKALLVTPVLAGLLVGCSIAESNEMLKMIDTGQPITLELARPSYEVVVQGEQQKIEWIQLDQLNSYPILRQGFDELFNINIVTENGINGKSGCLYVDETGDRNGNTTLEDALRNKVFVTKYWEKAEVKDKLVELAEGIYTDIDGDTVYGITGAINAYYNLLEDAKNPVAFNPTQSLTREQFYTLVFKSENGVRNITVNKSFEEAIGGPTKHSKFAQEVDKYAFISAESGSLDKNAYKGSISRAEAIYMVVNKHFQSELAKVKNVNGHFKTRVFGHEKPAHLAI